jgi:hypothetical protein
MQNLGIFWVTDAELYMLEFLIPLDW